jgi:hypothetical protein
LNGSRSPRPYPVGEGDNVLGAVSKWGGERDGDDIEAVVEILTEHPLADRVVQASVRRSDEAEIDPYRLRPADPLKLVLLKDAEQLRLEVRLQVADFIEEGGPAVGQLQLPARALVGARKGPALMPEQLALEQLFR